MNFTEHLASLECTSDGKLTAPQNKFELSAFTDQQSKLFGNDFTVPCVGEMSGRIDVNFSAIQQINEKDDLDEIQRDIARASSNMGCRGPFDGQNMSEYIEVDLNMTHVAVSNEEDMSMTDTVHSPVRDVSKSCSIDKKVSLNDDWAADKENIAINPYAAPKESINFALNDEPDQVLVFDGKRLTLQTEKADNDKNDYRKTLLPNSSADTPQRKTIVLNMNDDLPNFVDGMLNSKCENSGFSMQEMKSSTDYNDLDISMTLPVNRVDIVPKRKSIHDNTGNISVTQALPTNIICETVDIDEQKTDNRTIMYQENTGNISVTQALPVNIITDTAKCPERRRTVVYEDDTGNISITQAVPTNIHLNENFEGTEKRKTIVFDDDKGNISITQALSCNIILGDTVSEKRNTLVFDDDGGNVSITQAVPVNMNIVLSDKQLQEKRRTIIYEDDTGNISVTQAIPTNVILGQSENNEPVTERRRTIVYEDDTGNISVTQALPSNILLERIRIDGDKNKIEAGNIPTTQSLPTNIILKDSDVNKRRTIVYEDETGNISITQAIPTQLIPGYSEGKINATSAPVNESTKIDTSNIATNNKQRTFIDDDYDKVMTQATTDNILPEDGTSKRKTILFDNEDADISMTTAIPANVFLLDKLDSAADQKIEVPEDIVEEVKEKVTDYDNEQDSPMMNVLHERRTIVVVHADNCDAEMSIMEAIPKVQNILQESGNRKRKTIIFDNDNGNLSMTKPIPAELLAFQNEILNKSKNKELIVTEQDQVDTSPDIMNPCPDLIVYQATTTSSTPMLQNRIAKGDSNIHAEMELSSKMNDPEEKSISFQDSVQTELTSEDQSIIHPPLEVKSEKLNLKPSYIEMEIDEPVANVVVNREKNTPEIKDHITIGEPKDSVLNTLLDMSVSSMESGTVDQNVMAQIESNIDKEDTDNTSSDSMFYITRDSDEEAQTDREMDNKDKRKSITANEIPKILDGSPLPLEFKDEDPVIVDDLQKRLAELKTVVNKDKKNKLYENIVGPDLEGVVERDENVKLREQSITFRRANDTKELLDMISDFTDKKDEGEPSPAKAKGHMAIENKSEVTEPRRLSFAPNRKSIVLSREDLLNNISMAQAALQKSRLELDESDCLGEDTRDESIDQSSCKKPGRASNEVVKTLHFDDESLSETSIKSDTKASPLKKTAFGETSYMTESKAKVIPTYLKDVSDGIKELMMDLVKPMADTMPFEAGGVDKGVRKVPSTQSTQIQANLITSSQIDIDSELYSNPESGYDMDKMSSLTGGALNKSRSRSFRSPVKFSTNSSEKSSEFEVPSPRQRYLYSRVPDEPPAPARVLVFDHLNPLNNILLGSMDYSGAHKYNPRKSDETLCGSERSRSALIHFDPNTKDNDYDMDPVSTQYRMETRLSQAMKGEDPCAYKQEDEQSISSTISKPMSIDQSIDVKIMELKDIEVNTLIAMKGNKELLEASSSLTLVDDAIGHSITTERTNSQENQSPGHYRVKISRSPVEIIYKIEEQGTVTEIPESDFTSHEELQMLEHAKICMKGKKRIYSPAGEKYRHTQPLDVTPKPNSKMQKISNSPNVYRTELQSNDTTQMAPEKDVSVQPEQAIEEKGQSKVQDKKKSPRKSKEKKPGTNITVQQLITEYNMDAGNQNLLDKQILNAMNLKSEASTTPASQSDDLECNSLEVVSSFTSSKNLNAMKDVHSTSTTRSQQSTVPSKASRVDWHPELISALSTTLSDSDSRNVVAKIDMLPFMG